EVAGSATTPACGSNAAGPGVAPPRAGLHGKLSARKPPVNRAMVEGEKGRGGQGRVACRGGGTERRRPPHRGPARHPGPDALGLRRPLSRPVARLPPPGVTNTSGLVEWEADAAVLRRAEGMTSAPPALVPPLARPAPHRHRHRLRQTGAARGAMR